MAQENVFGYAALTETTFVEGLGTEVAFEVHNIEDGQPSAIVAFAVNMEDAKLLAAAPRLAELLRTLALRVKDDADNVPYDTADEALAFLALL